MTDITIYNYMIEFNLGPLDNYIHHYIPPLGQLYIISALKENGYNADFKDFQLLSPPKKENLLSFFENSSDVIGIGCMSYLLPSLILLIEELKKEHPEKTIILGGPGPTSAAEEILKVSPYVDIVVRGEGEETMVEVMDCLKKNKDLKDVRGITYRDGKKIHVNPPRPRIKNLDKIPFPAYDKIDINNYDMVNIITSRGCPYKCAFCCEGFLWGRGVITRSIDKVIEEIKIIYEKYYNKKFLDIADDTFPLNKKRVFDFCDKLKKEKKDINWGCHGRVNLMNDQIMRKMCEGGCKNIFYGIESGSDKILKKINKGFSVKMAEDAVTKSKKYFSYVNTSFIVAFPFETMEDFKKTIGLVKKFIFKLNINAGVNILRPEIGTQIYNNYKNCIIPFPKKPRIKLLKYIHSNSTHPRKTTLLRDNEDIFEIFKHQLNIVLPYCRYKTPNFSEKMKILERFIKKYNFYKQMKRGV